MIPYLYKENRLRFFLHIMLCLFFTIFEVGLAYIMMLSVDYALNGDLSDAKYYIVGFLAYVVTFFAIDFFTQKSRLGLLRRARMELRRDVLRDICKLSTTQFHRKNVGEWISILIKDIDIIESSYFKSFFNLFTNILQFSISIVLMMIISPYLCLFIFVIGLVQLLIPKIMGPKLGMKKKLLSDAVSAFTVEASEKLHAFDLLKSFHLTANVFEKVNHSSKSMEERQFHSNFFSALINLLSFTFGQILYVGTYFFGAILIIFGQMTLPMMIAASQLIVYITYPLISLNDDLAEFRSAKEIIRKLVRLKVGSDDQTHSIQKRSLEDCFIFDDVCFSYGDKSIIRDIRFKMHKNRKYLLRGASGIGKSTILKLITREIQPTSGRILIDETDISQISKEDYVKIISINSQNLFLFNASLRDNITIFQDSFTTEQLTEAVQFAGLSLSLDKRNGSYDLLDFIIGENGVNLSGGEKQRIALARMYLYQSDVMLFDESFSNLDKDSRNDIMRRLLKWDNKTIVYISHQIEEELASEFDSILELTEQGVVLS